MKWWLKNCCSSAFSFSKSRFKSPNATAKAAFISNLYSTQRLPFSSLNQNPAALTISRRVGHHGTNEDSSLTREWLLKLWNADQKRKTKRKPLPTIRANWRWSSSSASVTAEPSFSLPPPISQATIGLLQPKSPEEREIATLLARSNLLITRQVEWANLMVGFEQENRYAVVDPYYPQSPVGYISEQSNVIARQEIGVVHRRWHLWRRVYDLYLGKKQFATVENPGFWNWTFTMKDINGNVLAEIDRDWRGFGFELLTDAGQYVIRFGDVSPGSKTGPAKMIKDLEIDRPLNLSERAVAVALAVSLDNDYFSRHGGWGLPFLVLTE